MKSIVVFILLIIATAARNSEVASNGAEKGRELRNQENSLIGTVGGLMEKNLPASVSVQTVSLDFASAKRSLRHPWQDPVEEVKVLKPIKYISSDGRVMWLYPPGMTAEPMPNQWETKPLD